MKIYKRIIGRCDGRGGKYNKCDYFGLLANRSTGQCMKCNEKRKDAIKKQRLIDKHGKEEETLYMFFKKIARDRKHICFVTKEPVNVYLHDGKLNVSCFSHVLSRGAYKPLERLSANVVIVKPHIHQQWEHRTDDMRLVDMWKPKFALHDKLITEYYASLPKYSKLKESFKVKGL